MRNCSTMKEHHGTRIFGGFIFFTIALWCTQMVNCGAVSETTLNLPCKPLRTEISFPSIVDAKENSTSDIFSQPSPRNFLRVKMKWRRRPVEIILYKNDVIGRYSTSQWQDGNATHGWAIGKNCFYHGYIQGQAKSYVALSTCDGLSGYLQTNQEMLFIQPRGVVVSFGITHHAHIVYTCEPSSGEGTEAWQVHAARSNKSLYHRRKRSPLLQTKYLEVQLVVDHTLEDHIGSKETTETYVMELMNIANTVFQHKTLDIDIKVVVVKIIFLTRNQQPKVFRRNDARRTVNLFCQWSVDNIPKGQSMDYDISILLTKDKLGPSGYAPITGLCTPERSCAAVVDLGFITGFVIAHEIAHVFGLVHDGEGSASSCGGPRFDNSIMAATVKSKLNHYWWSECSKRRMHDVIRFLGCIRNKPNAIENHYRLEALQRIKPYQGEKWTSDFQCAMTFGEGFHQCRNMYANPCVILTCNSRGSPECRTMEGPPMPGTPCGTHKECHNGRCQYVGDGESVDGNWTEWSGWSDCSNNCGVGVKQRTRKCENPAPMYDGKDCAGEPVIRDTCYNSTCANYHDDRARECVVWDSIQVQRGTHKWTPYEPASGMPCKQTCKSSKTQKIMSIDINVSDGTPCSYLQASGDVCIEGRCLKVGCDGIINSTKINDDCGICGGNGSECKIVQGVYNMKPKSGHKYVPIITLPVGARKVTILQLSNTFRMMALKDVKYGVYLFNGDKRRSERGVWVKKGTLIHYGVDDKTKKDVFSIVGPLMSKATVMALPNSNLQNISIFYRYVVHKTDFTLEKNKFKWKFEKWSPCSVTCGSGVQSIIHGCQDKFTEKMVDIKHCTFLDKPRKDSVKCNRGICAKERYNYAMTNDFSECNARCGQQGFKIQMFICERYLDSVYEKVDMKHCSHLRKPNVIVKSCKGDPCNSKEQIQYKWAFSKWSQCMSLKDCGGPGQQTRYVKCFAVRDHHTKTNNSKTMVDDSKCNIKDKPESTQTCQADPCPDKFRWTAQGEWSECPCGNDKGTQSRPVICERLQQEGSGDEVTITQTKDQDCHNATDKPDSERSCQGRPCPPRFRWTVQGEWSECPCGNDKGTQSRPVICERLQQEGSGDEVTITQTKDQDCHNATDKPDSERSCQGRPCPPRFRWTVQGEWSECPCGNDKGTQSRSVICERLQQEVSGDEVTITQTKDQDCHNATDKPDSERSCQGRPCPPSFRWITSGEYSPCDAACGETSVQQPVLSCQQTVVWKRQDILEIVSDELCKEKSKPQGRQCHGEPCKPVFRWTATENWTECNAKCDQTATQHRVHICEKSYKNSNFTQVEDRLCTGVAKESETKSCQGPLCPLRWQTGRWSECSVTCGRGKRYRNVHCGDPDTDVDDVRCSDTPPLTSRRCILPLCPAPKADECRNVFSFCSSYTSLQTRCKRAGFRRKCCKTCTPYHAQGDNIPPPKNALERYMKQQGLGRWRKRGRR